MSCGCNTNEKRFVTLHRGVAQTKFKPSCAAQIKWLEIWRAGGKDWLLRYPVHEIDIDGNVVIQWDRDIFAKRDGWYVARLITCDCECCGEFALKLGDDCHSALVGNVIHSPDCSKTEGCPEKTCGESIFSNTACAPCKTPATEAYVPSYSTECM